jgi:NAD(P)H dehydrogenase (quinone)
MWLSTPSIVAVFRYAHPMSTAGTIAVTGATGGLGGRVARRLAGRGVAQRLVVRDPARAPQLAGAEAVPGSYDDGEGLRRAFDGTRTLFMVSASEAPDRQRLHAGVVDAAVAAGVERVVYTSFFGAAPDCTFTFGRDHWHAEEHIRASGLRYTFLRDNLYIDFLPLMAGADGMIRGPAGDGRVALVARDDIADVAVAVLLDGGDGHDGRGYDMTGPEALTLTEAAEELSRAAGRPIRYQPETLEEAYASRASYGAPGWEVDGWVTTYVAIANGDLEQVSGDVAAVAGHPPMRLAAFLRDNPDSYRRLRGAEPPASPPDTNSRNGAA